MKVRSYEEIPISSVSVTKLQIRSFYDKQKMRELIRSVRQEGVMQGIIVRPYKRGRYELVFGSRRLRAVRRTGRKTVPAIVVDNLSDKDAILMALQENLHRQDLDPFEEARAILRLMRVSHMNIEEIARGIGRNNHFICKRLKLLKMPKEVQELVAKKKLPVNHVDLLASLPVSQQREVAEQSLKHGLSHRDLQVHIQDALGVAPRIKSRKSISDWSPEKIQLRIRDFARFLKATKPIVLEMGTIDILNIRVALEKLEEDVRVAAKEYKRFIVG